MVSEQHRKHLGMKLKSAQHNIATSELFYSLCSIIDVIVCWVRKKVKNDYEIQDSRIKNRESGIELRLTEIFLDFHLKSNYRYDIIYS